MRSGEDAPGYRVLDTAGQGGFGVVYKAYQERLDRVVALKVLTVDRVDQRTMRRFQRELQLTGRLTGHPNVVTVFDTGTTRAGKPYIAMEFFENGSLRDRVRAQGPLPLADVLRTGVKLAAALAAVHEAGVLHGDIKPQNILVSRYGEPAIADFGVARVVDSSEMSATSQAFTPLHAAPEVVSGQPHSVASDVYSLGSTLYHLLAGQPAFHSPTDSSIAPLMFRVLSSEPPPINRPDVPPIAAEAILRAMAKAPGERYESAWAFARRLREVQEALGLPVTDLVSAEPAPMAEAPPPVHTSPYAPPSDASPYVPPSDASPYAPPPHGGPSYVPPSQDGSPYAPPAHAGSAYGSLAASPFAPSDGSPFAPGSGPVTASPGPAFGSGQPTTPSPFDPLATGRSPGPRHQSGSPDTAAGSPGFPGFPASANSAAAPGSSSPAFPASPNSVASPAFPASPNSPAFPASPNSPAFPASPNSPAFPVSPNSAGFPADLGAMGPAGSMGSVSGAGSATSAGSLGVGGSLGGVGAAEGRHASTTPVESRGSRLRGKLVIGASVVAVAVAGTVLAVVLPEKDQQPQPTAQASKQPQSASTKPAEISKSALAALAPRRLRVVSDKGAAVTVQWTLPAKTRRYPLVLQREPADGQQLMTMEAGATSARVLGLDPDTGYCFLVGAALEISQKSTVAWSKPHCIRGAVSR
ncbi:serine/threonine-protein kinase [Nonomuraea roseola]|uniref:non-specific serine/threonine protein kinase n=1 Tax=Nonomuraea roseola TaxID=46179 RepID=A0ABV5PUX3_9ACTN